MNEVSLHPAHMWTCPKCETKNFCEGVIAELNQEEKDQFKNNGFEPEACETGFWMTCPEEVKCQSCSQEYTVKDEYWNEDNRNFGLEL